MKPVVSLEAVIACIRDSQGIPQAIPITAATLLERDLGITGDDGAELLEDIQRHFAVSFTGCDGTLRAAFGLGEHEYLFHSEGNGIFSFLGTLLGQPMEQIRPLTVGALHSVIGTRKDVSPAKPVLPCNAVESRDNPHGRIDMPTHQR